MSLRLSCAFATSMATPDDVRTAEGLGYERAWLYDSPALYPDVWITLARAAERTTRIGLGPAVLVPSLRHPMATAAAIATVAELAGPNRVAVAVGTGFTGRFALGQRPLRWAFVADYVNVVRALLRGETASWEGAKMAMLHPGGFGQERPIDVPVLLGASGPRGIATAREIADGVFLTGTAPVSGFSWQARLVFGTVLDPGEDERSERVMAAAGHGAAVLYHFLVENNLSSRGVPNSDAWLDAYADVPDDERHLAMHDRHLVGVNDRDRPFITPELIRQAGGAFSAAELRDRLAELEAAGATEVAYQPAGPAIARELEAFASAANG